MSGGSGGSGGSGVSGGSSGFIGDTAGGAAPSCSAGPSFERPSRRSRRKTPSVDRDNHNHRDNRLEASDGDGESVPPRDEDGSRTAPKRGRRKRSSENSGGTSKSSRSPVSGGGGSYADKRGSGNDGNDGEGRARERRHRRKRSRSVVDEEFGADDDAAQSSAGPSSAGSSFVPPPDEERDAHSTRKRRRRSRSNGRSDAPSRIDLVADQVLTRYADMIRIPAGETGGTFSSILIDIPANSSRVFAISDPRDWGEVLRAAARGGLRTQQVFVLLANDCDFEKLSKTDCKQLLLLLHPDKNDRSVRAACSVLFNKFHKWYRAQQLQD